jgi:phosphate uptake regulator
VQLKRTIGVVKMGLITLRVSDDEKERLKQKADEKGLTLSDYVRAVILGSKSVKRKKATCEELKAVAYEINRIGVNINQIARRVNTTREIDIKVLEELSRIEDRLTEILKEILSLKAEPQQEE